MERARAEDLTAQCFDDPGYPLTVDTWHDWLSRSKFDAGPAMTLDERLSEPPLLFVMRNASVSRVYALRQVAYEVSGAKGPGSRASERNKQAPSVERVVLGRLNNSAFYLATALRNMDVHRDAEKRKRDREEAEAEGNPAGHDVRIDALMDGLLRRE